jgi:hypothetical protein
MAIERLLTNDVRLVLEDWRKMVLVSGPRQVGKTTLAKAMLATRPGRYFNWRAWWPSTGRRRPTLHVEQPSNAHLPAAHPDRLT